jgi:uncharacterized membrane protein YphA (DoxX/SURF4 family)
LEGRHLFGLCIMLIGAIWLASRNFVSVWQPLPESLPVLQSGAVAAGLLFLISGAALLFSRVARFGAIAAIPIFLLFVAKWITRIILLPTVAGTWSGCAEELVPVIGAVLILAWHPISGTRPRWVVSASRILFGLCAVSFGWVHFEALQQTADMVPHWIAGSGTFWAKATGIAHALGGLALLLNLRAQLVARLLAAMYFGFELIIWLPRLGDGFDQPIVWMGNAVTVIVAASALLLADAEGRSRRHLGDGDGHS